MVEPPCQLNLASVGFRCGAFDAGEEGTLRYLLVDLSVDCDSASYKVGVDGPDFRTIAEFHVHVQSLSRIVIRTLIFIVA